MIQLNLLTSLWSVAIIAFGGMAPSHASIDDPMAVRPPESKLPLPLLGLSSATGAFSNYAFLVDKHERTLSVWQSDGESVRLIGAWPTDIGERDGDKLVQGDRRTPEGIYFFQDTRDGRQVNYDQYGARIYTLDYPNYFDRLQKKSGNGIWFHAIPDTKSLRRGSRGCVVVRNQTINELSRYIDLKRTPMLIMGKVDYVGPMTWLEKKRALAEWLEGWRRAWVNKDIEPYLSLYAENFRGNGMDKVKWGQYKKSLAKRYQFIDVALGDIQVFNQGPTVVFRFLQSYKSNGKKDYGAKTLYASSRGNGFEIVGETWAPAQINTISSTAE